MVGISVVVYYSLSSPRYSQSLFIEDDRNSPDDLMQASFFTIPRNTCLKTSGSWTVHESNICASEGSKGICTGDLGGPLLVTSSQSYKQIGISSEFDSYYCVSKTKPQMFASVAYFASWIDENVCKFSTDKPASCSTTKPATAKPTMKPKVRKA
jgi:secreted trypsin-like serine protease